MSTETKYEGLKKHSREANAQVKRNLRSALVEMTHDTDYKSITVTALCQKAGVSRMAFYRNYDTVREVLYQIAMDLNQDVINAAGSPFRKNTSREWYITTFRLIAENQEEMRLMFQEDFQYQWMKIVNGFAVHDDRFPAEQKYQRMMWSGGFENAVSYWLNNGMKESPEEMADYCMQYLPHMMITEKTEPAKSNLS